MTGSGTNALHVLIASKSAEEHAERLHAAIPGLTVTAVAEDQGAEHLSGAEVLITIGRWLTPQMVRDHPGLRMIQCLITGTDHLVPMMRTRPDLIVANARGIHNSQMAETAFFHMLSLARGGTLLARRQAERRCERIVPQVLRGRTVTILGVGSIAEALGPLCKTFGMTVRGVSGSPRTVEGFDVIHPREQLRDAVAAADFLVILAPGTRENVGLVDAELIAEMKPGAFLLNLSRGAVVDEDALISALRKRRIAGAGLDVFSRFPLPADSPLWDLDNVVITPWIGGQSDRYVDDVAPLIASNVAAYRAGDRQALTNLVRLPETDDD